jgi:putative Mg2+ transporter-C (MgtC) family protein
MQSEYYAIVIRLLTALTIGAMIGVERSYHGRPAGFRTHSLVCLASSLLMLVTVYEGQWFAAQSMQRVVVDPTRMAQGIMTGIGFLGAGVIMKEGLSVRGLTTAASIWITAAIGILTGIGFFFPALLATVLTLGTLSLFRWIEARIPAQFYAHHMVRFAKETPLPIAQLKQLIAEHGFSVANVSYRMTGEGKYLEYRMVIRTHDQDNQRRLAESLAGLDTVVGFQISPTGD